VPDVRVIVPARDAAATLPRTLAALAAQTTSATAEVVVVDDCSRDATARVARDAGARVVRLGTPAGPGAARNAGAAGATAPALAFTDADCVPRRGWLEHGLACLERGADLVQGAVHPERPPGPYDRTVAVTAPSPLFQTASLFVRRELFARLGGFPPGVTPFGGKELGEDVLFGHAALAAGARTAFAPEAAVEHAVEPRGPLAFAAERARLVAFPELTRRAPGLRAAYARRLFLTRRSGAFDLALAGAAAAAVKRRPELLALAVPYAATYRPRPAQVAADAVACAALLAGSVRARTPVL